MKNFGPKEPPWWHVRNHKYLRLDTVEGFDEIFESAMESRTFAITTLNASFLRSHLILYLEFKTKSTAMRQAN
ncbi:hypothetical protein F4825DRAFT_413361, partial [Nemania diffusa]